MALLLLVCEACGEETLVKAKEVAPGVIAGPAKPLPTCCGIALTESGEATPWALEHTHDRHGKPCGGVFVVSRAGN